MNEKNEPVVDTTQNRLVTQAAKKQDEQTVTSVPYSQLFRFATRFDYFLMILGTLCSCGMGVALPLFTIFWGSLTNSFGDKGKMVDSARQVMYQFIFVGIGALFCGWGMFACWIMTGQRQGVECRKQYLKSLLRQQIGWFDVINQSQLATKFATDSFAFQGAIGQKVSTLFMTISMFIAGFSIAFSKGWLMTLVCIAALPLIFIGGALYGTFIQRKDAQFEKNYGTAGGQVEQAVSGIKTIKQLNGQVFETENYSRTLSDVTQKSTKFGMMIGFGLGFLFFGILTTYSLGFWFGSYCVEGSSICRNEPGSGNAVYNAGDTLVIFFSILMAGFNFTQVTPALEKMAQGRIAAARIFKILDRQTLIKSKENAIIPEHFSGVFGFERVTFAYPKDKNRKILNNLNFNINMKSTAFVGESGCGKSTIFQLMMRFYDPDEGRVTLDGNDLRDLDLNWLRSQIGYVGQEPVLFAVSLKENLLFGIEHATDEQINAALKKAEAFGFVNELKEKLDTFAGTSGGQISGGQKQRLAIARALLKNPKILLLDEATSALDRRNQKLIQHTLNKIAEERMTITIAHRIKTVMNCDQIFVLSRGEVIEKGTFQQLQKYKNIIIQKQEQQVEDHTTAEKATKGKYMVKVIDPMQKILQDEAKEEALKKQEEQLGKKYDESTFGRLFSYIDKKGLFFLGILVSLCNGVIFPIFSIFLAKMLAVFILFNDDRQQARRDANLYSLLFLLFGIASLILVCIQQTIFAKIGAQMTEKLRNQTYMKILKMPIVWFDKPKNSCGGISARLASECQSVNGLVTTYCAIVAQNLANLICGIVIAFIFEWRTTLVALGLIPFMIAAGAIQMAFATGFSAKTDAGYKDSSNLITQSMLNIRTVSSFGYENMALKRYEQKLELPLALALRKGHISGLLYGVSQFLMYIVIALIFYLGTIFIRDNNLSIADVFTAIYAIMFAGMTAGNNAHFMPDVATAKKAAANLFEILDAEDEDQIQIKESSKLLKTPVKGNIVFKNVHFKYPSRDEYVFRDLNLQVKEGWKVGLVGRSGCGKSTIFQLLQRFYELNDGEILVDGINIKDYDIHYLRSCLGVVSQEPVLFNLTIAENIRYNKGETSRQDIVNAANEANFNPETEEDDAKHMKTQTGLSDNQNGFEKNVGVKGSHISGGQKQRVAIARAIIRLPKILLLDEATSALDSLNEQKVQKSLDNIMKNKTSINIAHRIETIRDSDEIMVFEKGLIVEQGSYEQLLKLKGYFYKLQKGLQIL